MDNNEPVVDERAKYVAKLKTDLDKVIAGQSFERTNAGKLIIEILEADVNRFTADVLSDKFIDDHMGYVDARSKANYAASLLGRIKAVNNPDREKDIREKIELAESAE